MRPATIPLFALALSCAACSNEPPPAPPPPQKTVFDDQLKALEKAKAVQGTVDQQKRETDEKLKDAGG